MYDEVDWTNRSFLNKVLYFLFETVYTIYQCGYFYFFPMLMIAANYMSPECNKVFAFSSSSIEKDFTLKESSVCKGHDPSIFLTHIFDYSLF